MTDVDAGAVVGDRFELRERIASGGLATVWRAVDREADAAVALKCENDHEHDPDQVRAHFSRELRWFRHLADGPTPGSLVQFVDGAVRDDGAYVATELIEGDSLAALVGDAVTPGVETFRAVAGPICRAVAFLHRAGVVHLDLKPGNVLCRRRGPPAVIDLNSAVASDEETRTLFHPDPYKPPELTPTDARDEAAGPWSDVYALGKLFFFVLTGEAVAFDSAPLAEWHPVDPRSRGVSVADDLAAALRQATAPAPGARFADADALYAALRPHVDVPDGTARLVDDRTGRDVRVHPGDVVGRWSADRVPDVVLPDEGRYLSPEHAVVDREDGPAARASGDREDGRWILRDRSLNGTFVRKSGGWEYALSREGRESRRDADAPLPRPDPDASIRLADGDRIAPVSPRYGTHLAFRTDWE